jgi:EAL domain-containing protein (putative c-di-GMP-specific phosphodiesterase class I)
LQESCEAAAKWPRDVTLAIDIFPTQLRDRTLHSKILSILDASGVAPARLELEITENALVRDLEGARDALGSLRETGVKIVLDNFGTGYSNLYHLRTFKLDKIKIDRKRQIDRSFIESLGSRESAGIVSALVGLGHGLGLTVTAEGVEDPEQRASLLNAGCENGQGFFFSRALTAEETMSFVQPHIAAFAHVSQR